jgi:hypothetical protein
MKGLMEMGAFFIERNCFSKSTSIDELKEFLGKAGVLK